MTSELWSARAPSRVPILVSKLLHCLNDLLFRMPIGDLRIEIPLVVSNHPDAAPLAQVLRHPLPAPPVTPDTRRTPRRGCSAASTTSRSTSSCSLATCRSCPTTCAPPERPRDQHPPLVPAGFQGAKPYHQAHERGVKLIGATAHYVTGDLDEGPIIEQDVARADHAPSPTACGGGERRRGSGLSPAVRWYAEPRVLLNGHRTVVFR